MGRVYLEIEDLDSMMTFVRDIQKRTGLLKDISADKLEIAIKNSDKVVFPVKVPVELDNIVNLASKNPIVAKMFGKKIDDTSKKILAMVLQNI